MASSRMTMLRIENFSAARNFQLRRLTLIRPKKVTLVEYSFISLCTKLVVFVFAFFARSLLPPYFSLFPPLDPVTKKSCWYVGKYGRLAVLLCWFAEHTKEHSFSLASPAVNARRADS